MSDQKFDSSVNIPGLEALQKQDAEAQANNTTIGRYFVIPYERHGYAFYQVIAEHDADNYQMKHVDIGTECLPSLDAKGGVMLKKHVAHELAFRNESQIEALKI